ncbi:MAG: hypothetical protein ACOCZ9_00440 [Spirochaetota bacterium]
MGRVYAAFLIVVLFSYPAVATAGRPAPGAATRDRGNVLGGDAWTGGAQDFSGESEESGEDEPAPYDPQEFPEALRHLRRFEIVALGSVPLTVLFSSLGYRLHRVSTEENINWQTSANFSLEQRRRVLTIGLSASLAVGVLDFILGRVEGRRQ